MGHSSTKAMIRQCTEEARRPGEWLLRFVEDRSRYLALLAESGSLAVAAYRLARARCRVQPVPSAVPTDTELWAAARRIVVFAHVPDGLPSKAHLAAECEACALPVIGPPARQNAA